jgi:hypothetical protein
VAPATLASVSADWVPFGYEAEHAERASLVEGVPEWIEGSVFEWIEQAYWNVARSDPTGAKELTRAFDRQMRLSPPLTQGNSWPDSVLRSRGDARLTFAFVDFMLTKGKGQPGKLAAILNEGGSAYRVVLRGSAYRLERRVAEGAQLAAEHAMREGDAGALLAEAWSAAYGRDPDAEEAYEKAIKAVEQSAIPVVTPSDRLATLGKVINVLKTQKDWALPLTDQAGAHDPEAVLHMCQQLWLGQPSRHGANGYRKPTQQEAESAVLLAVPLVQMFESELIARRSVPGTP